MDFGVAYLNNKILNTGWCLGLSSWYDVFRVFLCFFSGDSVAFKGCAGNAVELKKAECCRSLRVDHHVWSPSDKIKRERKF